MITSPEGQTRSLCLHSLPAAQPHQEGLPEPGFQLKRRFAAANANTRRFDFDLRSGRRLGEFRSKSEECHRVWHVSSDFATAENGDRQFAAAFDEPARKHKKRCTAGTFRQVGASRILVVWSIES
jgi:hypothetical protein